MPILKMNRSRQTLLLLTTTFPGMHFLQESFEESEQAARKTLELSPESVGVVSNLASALLFQGKYEEALAYYQEWKDKKWPDDRYGTFCKVFLSDLKELEERWDYCIQM